MTKKKTYQRGHAAEDEGSEAGALPGAVREEAVHEPEADDDLGVAWFWFGGVVGVCWGWCLVGVNKLVFFQVHKTPRARLYPSIHKRTPQHQVQKDTQSCTHYGP